MRDDGARHGGLARLSPVSRPVPRTLPPRPPPQWLAAAANPQLIAGTASGPATWALAFPPIPGYPNGGPAPISAVVVINRLDGGTNARMNASGSPGVLALLGANGTVVSTRAVSSLSVSVFNFPNSAQSGPVFPNNSASTAPAAFQSAPGAQLNFVRYINVSAAPGACLAFRELYAFDNTLTNVALYKPTAASLPSYTDSSFGGFTSYASYGVDGIIDMDGAAGNMVHLPCNGEGWWQVGVGLRSRRWWLRSPWVPPAVQPRAAGVSQHSNMHLSPACVDRRRVLCRSFTPALSAPSVCFRCRWTSAACTT